MNELRFLKVIGKIDEDLLKEADVDIEKQYSPKPFIFKRSIYAFGSVAAAVVAIGSVAFYNSYKPFDHSATQPLQVTTQEPKYTDSPTEIRASDYYYKRFDATVNPDSDAYGADEVHHIDVRTADGFYRQLAPDEYDTNGISSTISFSDFGGYIGKIVEVNDCNYHGNGAESQEPSLAGADVYYYAPTGNNKMFIIVKKGDQCSMFIADEVDVSSGFRNGLAFFDVHSADDIRTIKYQIDVPDDSGRMITSVQKTITDTETIRIFYELICQLQPEDYSSLPDHIGTPQWLVDAWENYSSAPTSAREDIGITIRLTDGAVLQDISYRPYLGNGYIEGMQELTPEQNAALRKLLG